MTDTPVTLLNLETESRSIVIVQSISNGDTTHAPSGDAVYDALVLKEATSNKSSNMTTDTGSTTKYPSVKAVEDYVESIIGDIEEDMLS